MKKALLLILGFFLAYVSIPQVSLPIDYPLHGTEVTERVAIDREDGTRDYEELTVVRYESGYDKLFTAVNGERVRLEVLLGAAGFLLLAVTACLCRRNRESFIKTAVLSLVGLGAIAVNLLASFLLVGKERFTLCICAAVFLVVLRTLLMVVFANTLQSMTDAYLHMEVHRDLVFAAELYGFFSVIGFAWTFFKDSSIINLRGLWYLYLAGAMIGVVYFIWKVFRYSQKLKLFEDSGK